MSSFSITTRESESLMKLITCIILAVAATADGQAAKPLLAHSATAPPADTAAPTTAAVAPLPKWINEIAVDAFVSTGYLYNFNRPATGANSYRVFDFVHNTFNLDVAELVVQMAPSKP